MTRTLWASCLIALQIVVAGCSAETDGSARDIGRVEASSAEAGSAEAGGGGDGAHRRDGGGTADSAAADSAAADSAAADSAAAKDSAAADSARRDSARRDSAADTVADSARADAPRSDSSAPPPDMAAADTSVDSAAKSDASVADVGVDGPAPSCNSTVTGFGAAKTFALPSYPNGIWTTEYAGSCSSGNTRYYTLRDIDGDGRKDLVITLRCYDPDVGKKHWIVHKNLGSSFAATGVKYALPSYPNGIWRAEYAGSCSSGNTRYFTLRDMDADGRPDLVITLRCYDPDIGKKHWIVHKNLASGFASTGVKYTLPSYPNGIWRAEYAGSCSSGNTRYFTLRDMDADGRPDLVITLRCYDPDIGKKHWIVHKNLASGFASTGVKYTLPSYPNGIWRAEYAGSCSSGNTRYFTLRDMDADGRPDLVITLRCYDPDIGKKHWIVHKNLATGFAAGTKYTLPSYPNGIWRAEYAGSCSSGDTRYFTLRDINADGRPDLVITLRCYDPLVGKTHWLVHRNTPSGFAPAVCFPLPSYPNGVWRAHYASSCSSGNTYYFSLTDMGNDGRPDLTMTSRCYDPNVGRKHWIVHSNPGLP